jgi:hypothetical protein
VVEAVERFPPMPADSDRPASSPRNPTAFKDWRSAPDTGTMKAFARLAVPLVATIAVACSSSPGIPSGQPLRIRSHVTVGQLPAQLHDWYAAQAKDMPSDGAYFRPGTSATSLAVYETPLGNVYVDPGGGGMAMATDCAALDIFKSRNGWQRASGCLK